MRFSVIVVLVMTTVLLNGCHKATEWSVTVYEDDKNYKEYSFTSECIPPLTKDGSLATASSGICVKLYGRDTNTDDWNTVLFQDISQENLETGEKIGEDLCYSIRLQWIGDTNKTEYRFFTFSEKGNTLSLTVNKELQEDYERALKEYERAGDEMTRAGDQLDGAPAFVFSYGYDGNLKLRSSEPFKAFGNALKKEQQAREKYDRIREKREISRQRIVKDFFYNLKNYNMLIAEIPLKFPKSDFRGAKPVYFHWSLSGLQSAYAELNKNNSDL